jgi:hypothetical protein
MPEKASPSAKITSGLPEEALSKKRRKFRPQHINFRRKGYLATSNSFPFWAGVITAHAFASAEPRRVDSTPLFLNLVIFIGSHGYAKKIQMTQAAEQIE